jgi:adenosylhomocysteine nucleosidase
MAQAGEIASGPAGHGLGIVVGSAAAARCFARLPGGVAPLIVVSHGDPGRARTGARQLAAEGVRAIISFGPAVGLAPVLRPGDLVIAECVVLPSGETLATDLAWRTQLVRCLSPLNPSLKVARLAGRDLLAASAGEKRAVFQATFAAALDSESHAIAPGGAGGGPCRSSRCARSPIRPSRAAPPPPTGRAAATHTRHRCWLAWAGPGSCPRSGGSPGTAAPRWRPCVRSPLWGQARWRTADDRESGALALRSPAA